MTHGVTQLLTAIAAEPLQARGEAQPSTRSARAPDPDALRCLRCQLLGRPRLTCTRADVCREIPRCHPLGAALLAAWLVIAVAFVIAAM